MELRILTPAYHVHVHEECSEGVVIVNLKNIVEEIKQCSAVQCSAQQSSRRESAMTI